MDLNEVNLLGRAVRDTELKSTPSGKSVATNSVATGKSYTGQDGKKVENTEFHNLVFWGKVAEIAANYLTKGKRVYIKGELNTRSWDDKDTGKKMYRTEIVVREMILLDGGRDKGGDEFTESDKKHFGKQEEKQELTVEDLPF